MLEVWESENTTLCVQNLHRGAPNTDRRPSICRTRPPPSQELGMEPLVERVLAKREMLKA